MTLTQEQYKISGIVLLVFGVVFLIGSLVLFFMMNNEKKAVMKAYATAAAECSGRVREMGFEVVGESRNEVKAQLVLPDLQQALFKLGEANTALLMCPGWVPASFCMGSACQSGDATISGISFVLKFDS